MDDNLETLVLDLLEWIRRKERTYQETMDAWRTSCPRLPIWEEANDRGLIQLTSVNGRSLICLTPVGVSLLKEQRPHSLEEQQRIS